MNNYTFSSTGLNFNEINCPLYLTGSGYKVRWQVKKLVGNCKIKVLDKDDFIEIDNKRLYLKKAFFDLESPKEKFIEYFQDAVEKEFDIMIEQDFAGRWNFYSLKHFSITNCSYYLKQVLGLYNYSLPINPKVEGRLYDLQIESSGYKLGSSLWFGLCNAGSSCIITNFLNNVQVFSMVCFRLFNNYSQNSRIDFTNQEFNNTCSSSNLNYLQIKIVDENLQPIRFISPVYVYIDVEVFDLTPEEQKPFLTTVPNEQSNEKIKQQKEKMKKEQLFNFKKFKEFDQTKESEAENYKFFKTPFEITPTKIITHTELQPIPETVEEENKEQENVEETEQEQKEELNKEEEKETLI